MTGNGAEHYHHPLSMSKAPRWIPCPGSVAACEDLPDRPGEPAKFGTDVHAVMAKALTDKRFPAMSSMKFLTKDVAKIEETARTVLAAVTKVVQKGEHLDIERRVTLDLHTLFFEPLSGTLDLGAYRPGGRLKIVDYKTGYKAVSAEKNLQLLGYALGEWDMLDAFYQSVLDEIELTIIQVNESVGCQIKSWVVSAEELNTTYRQLYQDAVERVELAPDVRIAGRHCTDTYCPAAPTCPALKDYIERGLNVKLDEIQAGTTITPAINKEATPEELNTWLEKAEVLGSLVSQIKDLALAKALDGETFEGRKLVRSYGHKKWSVKEEEVLARATEVGVQHKITTLKTPAQVAKIAKDFDTTGLWVKPETGWRLVRDDEDFADE